MPDGEGKMDYAKLVLVMMNQRVDRGYSFLEMAERLDLRNKFKDAPIGKLVEITDAEYAIIMGYAETFRWSVLNDDIVKFGDYLGELANQVAPTAAAVPVEVVAPTE